MAAQPQVTVLAGPSKEDLVRFVILGRNATNSFWVGITALALGFVGMLAGVASPVWTNVYDGCSSGLYGHDCDGGKVLTNPRALGDSATLQSVLSLSIIGMLLTLASLGLAIQMKRATQASIIKKWGILSGIISVLAALTSLAADIIYASDSWTPDIITPTSPNPGTSRQLLAFHIIHYVSYTTTSDHKIPHLDYSFVLHLMGCIVLLVFATPTILFSTMYASRAAQLKNEMANKMATTLTNHIRVMAVVNALNSRYTSLQQKQQQQQQQQQRQLQQRQALYDGQFGGQGLGTSSVDLGQVTTEFAGGDVEI